MSIKNSGSERQVRQLLIALLMSNSQQACLIKNWTDIGDDVLHIMCELYGLP